MPKIKQPKRERIYFGSAHSYFGPCGKECVTGSHWWGAVLPMIARKLRETQEKNRMMLLLKGTPQYPKNSPSPPLNGPHHLH